MCFVDEHYLNCVTTVIPTVHRHGIRQCAEGSGHDDTPSRPGARVRELRGRQCTAVAAAPKGDSTQTGFRSVVRSGDEGGRACDVLQIRRESKRRSADRGRRRIHGHESKPRTRQRQGLRIGAGLAFLTLGEAEHPIDCFTGRQGRPESNSRGVRQHAPGHGVDARVRSADGDARLRCRVRSCEPSVPNHAEGHGWRSEVRKHHTPTGDDHLAASPGVAFHRAIIGSGHQMRAIGQPDLQRVRAVIDAVDRDQVAQRPQCRSDLEGVCGRVVQELRRRQGASVARPTQRGQRTERNAGTVECFSRESSRTRDVVQQRRDCDVRGRGNITVFPFENKRNAAEAEREQRAAVTGDSLAERLQLRVREGFPGKRLPGYRVRDDGRVVRHVAVLSNPCVAARSRDSTRSDGASARGDDFPLTRCRAYVIPRELFRTFEDPDVRTAASVVAIGAVRSSRDRVRIVGQDNRERPAAVVHAVDSQRVVQGTRAVRAQYLSSDGYVRNRRSGGDEIRSGQRAYRVAGARERYAPNRPDDGTC